MKRGVICLFVALFVVSGCATWDRITGKEEPPRPKSEMVNQVFYTFPDIPLPKELELVRGRSFIYETPNLKAGVLVLTGNVDVASLENYFKVNMTKNGWRFQNSYKYGDIIQNYVKEDRASTVRMSRDAFSTSVEIWVGPLDRSFQRGDGPMDKSFQRGDGPK